MPQPFAMKLGQDERQPFRSQGGLEARPLLSAAFGEAVAEFSLCERSLAALIQALLRDDPDRGKNILDVVIPFSGRIREARKVARGLEVRERAIVEVALHRAESAAKQRNDIAHGRWGYSDSLPDAVLWLPASEDIHQMYCRLRKLKGLPSESRKAEVGVMVYVVRDFQSIKKACTDALAPLDLATDALMNDEPAKTHLIELALTDPVNRAKYDSLLEQGL